MSIFIPKTLFRAYNLAKKSRKKKQEVYLFDLNLEANILQMLDDLQNRIYRH
jgi:5-methylthioribose kinase